MKKVNWVKKMYKDWRIYRHSLGLEYISCDLENVTSITKESLIFALTRFITEVKKVDGSDFPARTLYDIIICVQFHLESLGYTWKLISEDAFTEVKFTLDNIMKRCTAEGVGVSVCKAQVLSFTDEDLLWLLGLMGVHSPEALLNAVVYTVGMYCALRAGKEHRVLRSPPFKSQFEFLNDSESKTFIRYSKDLGLKTNKGGLKHRKIDSKVVDIYQIDDSVRCPVHIIQTYLSKLPKVRNCEAFYLQPKHKYTLKSWYLDRPVGVNSLQTVIKDMCKKAQLPGYYTNHSLRANCATRMYQNDVEEQVIQEITGHRSLAVRSYKCTSEKQKRNAMKSLCSQDS